MKFGGDNYDWSYTVSGNNPNRTHYGRTGVQEALTKAELEAARSTEREMERKMRHAFAVGGDPLQALHTPRSHSGVNIDNTAGTYIGAVFVWAPYDTCGCHACIAYRKKLTLALPQPATQLVFAGGYRDNAKPLALAPYKRTRWQRIKRWFYAQRIKNLAMDTYMHRLAKHTLFKLRKDLNPRMLCCTDNGLAGALCPACYKKVYGGMGWVSAAVGHTATDALLWVAKILSSNPVWPFW